MTHTQANYYMATHHGDAPMVGYKVQQQAIGFDKEWSSLSLCWDSYEGAKQQVEDIATPNYKYRIVRLTVEPL